MNRRRLLQGLIAAIGSAALPSVATSEPTVVVNDAGRFEFLGPEFFDLGYQIGLAIRLPNGKLHGVRRLCKRRSRFSVEDVTDLKRELLDWAQAQYGAA